MAEYRLNHPISKISGRRERLTILAALFIFLTIAAAGITSVLINPDWSMLWRGLLFGLLLGWGLAKLKQKGWVSGLLIVITGYLYTLLFGGGLEQKIYSLLEQFTAGFSRYVFFPEDYPADISLLEQQILELANRGVVLSERVGNWIWTLVAGRAEYDPISTALIWGFILWLVAAWAGWVAVRYRNPLLAVLPGVLLSVSTLTYSQSVPFTVYLLLGLTLLLMAFVHYERREEKWDEAQIAYPSKKGLQINSAALLLAIGLVIFASILSSLSLPRILEWVSSLRENALVQEVNLGDSFGIQAKITPTPDPFIDSRSPGLPREMLIGSGPELSKRPVMTVEIEAFPQIFSGQAVIPIYWKSHTYDAYTGHGWQTSKTTLDEYQPNQQFQPEGESDHIVINQIVRSAGNEIRSLFAAGDPISINQTSTAAWRSPGDLFGVQINPTQTYGAQSQVLSPDAESLRKTGQQYPEWVRKHYLPIPEDLPGRVNKLALQLTASEPTPYDRTRAVESYLRSIPYSLDVPHPPPDQDLVDYFLFDLRLGYCDYYASAMVILLRSAGVPARIATGYASGTYNLNTKRFMVTEADAHTWAEVYFPGVGWIPFEPTGSRPTWEPTQTDLMSLNTDQQPSEIVPGQNNQKAIAWFWYSIMGVFALLSVLSLAFIVYDELRLYSLPEPAAAAEIYSRLKKYSMYLGVPDSTGKTPYEFAALFTSYLLQLTWGRGASNLRLTTTMYIETIIDRIVKVSYNPNPSQISDSPGLYHQWRTLRWRLRALWLQDKFDRWRDWTGRVLKPGPRRIVARSD